jgi:predicted anti-sigma-YlaC factor YlaD
MGNLRRKNRDCSAFRDALENAPGVSALPAALQEHLAACPECRPLADEFSRSRALLADLPRQRYEPSAWFVSRVMSVINARESELRQSTETWSLIPRLAAKLAWISALALVLAGTWAYERPRVTHQNDASAGESLFDSPSPAAPDDLLAGVVEHE